MVCFPHKTACCPAAARHTRERHHQWTRPAPAVTAMALTLFGGHPSLDGRPQQTAPALMLLRLLLLLRRHQAVAALMAAGARRRLLLLLAAPRQAKFRRRPFERPIMDHEVVLRCHSASLSARHDCDKVNLLCKRLSVLKRDAGREFQQCLLTSQPRSLCCVIPGHAFPRPATALLSALRMGKAQQTNVIRKM